MSFIMITPEDFIITNPNGAKVYDPHTGEHTDEVINSGYLVESAGTEFLSESSTGSRILIPISVHGEEKIRYIDAIDLLHIG